MSALQEGDCFVFDPDGGLGEAILQAKTMWRAATITVGQKECYQMAIWDSEQG